MTLCWLRSQRLSQASCMYHNGQATLNEIPAPQIPDQPTKADTLVNLPTLTWLPMATHMATRMTIPTIIPTTTPTTTTRDRRPRRRTTTTAMPHISAKEASPRP
jgi:hypothetical protein